MHNLLLELMLRLLFLGSSRHTARGLEVVLGLVVSSRVIMYDVDKRLR